MLNNFNNYNDQNDDDYHQQYRQQIQVPKVLEVQKQMFIEMARNIVVWFEVYKCVVEKDGNALQHLLEEIKFDFRQMTADQILQRARATMQIFANELAMTPYEKDLKEGLAKEFEKWMAGRDDLTGNSDNDVLLNCAQDMVNLLRYNKEQQYYIPSNTNNNEESNSGERILNMFKTLQPVLRQNQLREDDFEKNNKKAGSTNFLKKQ
ncbi:hypothetical protein ABK040_002846 [Willaertia magna]